MAGVRDHRLDNAKGLLIILVVYAHILSNIFGRATFFESSTWTIINFFHMGSFLIISGFLSRGRIDNKSYDKSITKLLVPYLFAQFGLFVMFAVTGTLKNFWVTKDSNTMVWFRPSGALWYLFGIFVYIIVTSVIFGKKRKPNPWFVLGIAVILSLCTGFVPPVWYFRFTKLISFYPYFLLGYIVSDKSIRDRILNTKMPVLKGIVMLVAGIGTLTALFFRLYEKINLLGIISMEENGMYAECVGGLKYYYLQGPVIRLVILCLATIICYGLILSIPNKKSVFSYIGQNSLFVYVLHWFIIRGVGIIKIYADKVAFKQAVVFFTGGWRDVWLTLTIVFVLCLFLSSKPIRFIFRPFLQPDIDLKEVLGRILDKRDKKEKA